MSEYVLWLNIRIDRKDEDEVSLNKPLGSLIGGDSPFVGSCGRRGRGAGSILASKSLFQVESWAPRAYEQGSAVESFTL